MPPHSSESVVEIIKRAHQQYAMDIHGSDSGIEQPFCQLQLRDFRSRDVVRRNNRPRRRVCSMILGLICDDQCLRPMQAEWSPDETSLVSFVLFIPRILFALGVVRNHGRISARFQDLPDRVETVRKTSHEIDGLGDVGW